MKKLFFGFWIAMVWMTGCEPNGEKMFFAKNNVALGGYDVVAYFMDASAEKGSPEFKATYQGVDFYFKNPSYRDEFLRTPEKYLPAYGGWCAYRMATESEKIAPDPRLWVIQNGKLLLFSDDDALNGKNKARWVVKAREYHRLADENWAGISEK